MRSSRFLPLLLFIALSLTLACELALASPARSRQCRRALYLSTLHRRGELDGDDDGGVFLRRFWRSAALPAPLGLDRRPPQSAAALAVQIPSTSSGGGTSGLESASGSGSGSGSTSQPSLPPRPPPHPFPKKDLLGLPSQARTRQERKKEVALKKQQYENLRAGRAIVDMMIDHCGDLLQQQYPEGPPGAPFPQKGKKKN